MQGEKIMLTLCAILSILPGFLGLFLLFLLVSGSVVQGEDVIIRILIGSFLCAFIFGLLAMHFSRKRRLRESPAAEIVNSHQEPRTEVDNVQYMQQIVLFLKWCRRNTRFLPEDHYPAHMKTDWEIDDPAQFHRELLQWGYLEEMSLEQRIRNLRAPELKQLLKEMDLPVSGRKNDLIQRVLENGDFDTILGVIGEQPEFCLTEKAYQLLADYDDMISFESAVRSLQSYQADGVEKYQILAALDKETCEFCGSMDGKIFSVSNAVIGKNVPPFHSKCRCTTVPYYDDTDLTNMSRVARDPETGKTYDVPGDMTYNEWKKTGWNSRR